jgi:hypothetical protein
MGSLIPQATNRLFESAKSASKLIDEKKALFGHFFFSPAFLLVFLAQKRNLLVKLRLGLPIIQHLLR